MQLAHVHRGARRWFTADGLAAVQLLLLASLALHQLGRVQLAHVHRGARRWLTADGLAAVQRMLLAILALHQLGRVQLAHAHRGARRWLTADGRAAVQRLLLILALRQLGRVQLPRASRSPVGRGSISSACGNRHETPRTAGLRVRMIVYHFRVSSTGLTAPNVNPPGRVISSRAFGGLRASSGSTTDGATSAGSAVRPPPPACAPYAVRSHPP